MPEMLSHARQSNRQAALFADYEKSCGNVIHHRMVVSKKEEKPSRYNLLTASLYVWRISGSNR